MITHITERETELAEALQAVTAERDALQEQLNLKTKKLKELSNADALENLYQVGLTQEHDIVALEKERDSLKADAERYRWLRVQNADLDAGFYFGDETDALPEDITWVGSDLDAAVDLAMKGTS